MAGNGEIRIKREIEEDPLALDIGSFFLLSKNKTWHVFSPRGLCAVRVDKVYF